MLVASAVSAPSGDVVWGVVGSGGGCPEVAGFVAGKGVHCFVVRGCGWWCLCPVVCGGDGEEGVGEYGQGGPVMPGGPGADLVFVWPGASLAGLGVFLDPLAGAGDLDQRVQVDFSGGVAQEVGEFAGVRVAVDQQPPVMWWLLVAVAVGGLVDAGVGLSGRGVRLCCFCRPTGSASHGVVPARPGRRRGSCRWV